VLPQPVFFYLNNNCFHTTFRVPRTYHCRDNLYFFISITTVFHHTQHFEFHARIIVGIENIVRLNIIFHKKNNVRCVHFYFYFFSHHSGIRLWGCTLCDDWDSHLWGLKRWNNISLSVLKLNTSINIVVINLVERTVISSIIVTVIDLCRPLKRRPIKNQKLFFHRRLLVDTMKVGFFTSSFFFSFLFLLPKKIHSVIHDTIQHDTIDFNEKKNWIWKTFFVIKSYDCNVIQSIL